MSEFADKSREEIVHVERAVKTLLKQVTKDYDNEFLIHWSKEDSLSNAAIDMLHHYLKPVGITEAMLAQNADQLAKKILAEFAKKRGQKP